MTEFLETVRTTLCDLPRDAGRYIPVPRGLANFHIFRNRDPSLQTHSYERCTRTMEDCWFESETPNQA